MKKYTVYNNKTDFPVIVDGTSAECAKAMGIKFNSFHSTVTRARKGEIKKWTVLTMDEEDLNECD